MIYIIYGASGSGKTTLLNCVINRYGSNSIHRKGTTREKRQYDDFEIESFPEGLPKERFAEPNGYIYSSYGYEYGIEKAQFDRALENKIPHFVICNDIATIKKIRADYKDKVFVIYFQFDAPRNIILEIQKTRKISDDEIELRMSKIDFLAEQFAQNMYLFDTSLLNRYGDNPEIALSRDLESIITRYEESPLRFIPDKEVIFDTIDYLVKVTRETEQKKSAVFDVQVDKGFIFIIMPMMKDADINIKNHISSTYYSIKEAASTVNCGFRAERIDNISGSSAESIDNKILENIEKAEFIVADLTFERPNCYFELGYARALGKDIIIISSKGTKIHFDVDHYDRIDFDSSDELKKELTYILLKKNANRA